ncbi:MAG: DUF817 domain-containing protein [Pleurocapsa sp. SU_196_0]|nr:DUF817 domain-containing protein [Pleurocapsa sp. SU_196_0]
MAYTRVRLVATWTRFTAILAVLSLFVFLVLVQVMMYALKLETLEEIKFITLFHLVGFVLEQFKTHVGSWAYPEFGFTKIAGVPLYSGFMYAAVGSCIAQAWRLMRVTLHAAPKGWVSWSLGVLDLPQFLHERHPARRAIPAHARCARRVLAHPTRDQARLEPHVPHPCDASVRGSGRTHLGRGEHRHVLRRVGLPTPN